jgi:hypothetical protein
MSIWNNLGSWHRGGKISFNKLSITLSMLMVFSWSGIVMLLAFLLGTLWTSLHNSATILFLYKDLPTPALRDFTTRTLHLKNIYKTKILRFVFPLPPHFHMCNQLFKICKYQTDAIKYWFKMWEILEKGSFCLFYDI